MKASSLEETGVGRAGKKAAMALRRRTIHW